MSTLGDSDLDVFPLCLGGNVFGWTADRETSFAVLDAYAAAGGNFIDTADLYARHESERIIGEWLRRSGRRDQLVIATKIGMSEDRPGLGADNIRAGCEESLERLQTDRIDLYYAHRDDPDTPLEETLAAFDRLVRAGKVRYVAASNYDAARLAQALEVSAREGLARYIALQPHYNLVERGEYEGALQDLCEAAGLACLPYFGLAKGFLTGKYRSAGRQVDSPRAERARAYLERGGVAVLEALDEVAQAHEVPIAAVALAWLRAQPTVVAPIASARTVHQLQDLLPLAELELDGSELERLDQASRRLDQPV
jgi:aryl-alcohol dehydrogenase-like predicted oxidoreductase